MLLYYKKKLNAIHLLTSKYLYIIVQFLTVSTLKGVLPSGVVNTDHPPPI